MYRLVATLFLLGVLACACQPDHDAPREIAHKYLKARLDQKFGEASQYLSQESVEHFLALEALSLEFEPLTSPSYRIISVDQKGAEAQVTYQINGTDQDQLELVRKDTHWMVQLTELSIPDAGLLYQELKSLEQEEAQDLDLEDLHKLILEDEEVGLADIIASE
ncbi:MAG: hypothetical protein AAFV07_02640 [Bacteroidota bacterium]